MDITKCTYKCPLNDRCSRFVNTSIKKYEIGNYVSYFAQNPSKVIHGKFECDMYYGNISDAEYFLEQLKSILNAKRS